jgi:hypothetical protein
MNLKAAFLEPTEAKLAMMAHFTFHFISVLSEFQKTVTVEGMQQNSDHTLWLSVSRWGKISNY